MAGVAVVKAELAFMKKRNWDGPRHVYVVGQSESRHRVAAPDEI